MDLQLAAQQLLQNQQTRLHCGCVKVVNKAANVPSMGWVGLGWFEILKYLMGWVGSDDGSPHPNCVY